MAAATDGDDLVELVRIVVGQKVKHTAHGAPCTLPSSRDPAPKIPAVADKRVSWLGYTGSREIFWSASKQEIGPINLELLVP